MAARLGIGNSTPYSQASNHATAYNHCHRDTKAFEPARQTKVKCGYCGVWVRRGGICRLCRTPQAGAPPDPGPPPEYVSPRRNSTRPSMRESEYYSAQARYSGQYSVQYPGSAAPQRPSSSARRGSARLPSSSPHSDELDWSSPRRGRSGYHSRPTGHVSALNHKHRDEVPYDPARQTKVKCRGCGCWAPKAGRCGLCGRVAGVA